jgi:hypothetical protein
MKALYFLIFSAMLVRATVIDVVQVFQPISLHGSDVGDEVDDTGESLQASILSRPMALTGGFPEVLVESIAMPHELPTNNENYKIKEVNLVVICGLKIDAELDDDGMLLVEINIANMVIPEEIDMTARQVLRLIAGSIKKTLLEYNTMQKDDLRVQLRVVGTNESNHTLQDLGNKYLVDGKAE